MRSIGERRVRRSRSDCNHKSKVEVIERYYCMKLIYGPQRINLKMPEGRAAARALCSVSEGCCISPVSWGGEGMAGLLCAAWILSPSPNTCCWEPEVD